MISMHIQIAIISLLLFALFALLFGKAIKNEARVRVLVALALAALLFLGIGEFAIFFHVTKAA